MVVDSGNNFRRYFIQFLIFITLFISVDLGYSIYKIDKESKAVDPNAGLHHQNDLGFYWLDSNVNKGVYTFGSIKFPIYTNQYGFRCSNKWVDISDSIDAVFLGDSFTYGEGEWDQTFVGMYENLTRDKIFNCGSPSYSPSVYLYQYKKALFTNRLKQSHKVFICLDISDIQDESTRWEYPIKKRNNIDMNGIEFPIIIEETRVRRKLEDSLFLAKNAKSNQSFKDFISNHLRLTSFIYVFFKKIIFKKELMDRQRAIFEANSSLYRSGITHIDWNALDTSQSGYKPLGVRMGLKKVGDRIKDISHLAKQYQGEVYIVIYPWPAQLLNDQSEFDWENYWSSFCKSNKIKLINCFPEFKNKMKKGVNPQNFFIRGDIHYNEYGNKIIADKIIESSIVP